jgi:hypothetical protein
MASRLYTDTLQEGSRFTRVDKGAFGLVDWRPAGIEAQVQRIRRSEATRDQLRDNQHAMPPDHFEALIGELLIQMGFDERTVEVTKTIRLTLWMSQTKPSWYVPMRPGVNAPSGEKRSSQLAKN